MSLAASRTAHGGELERRGALLALPPNSDRQPAHWRWLPTIPPALLQDTHEICREGGRKHSLARGRWDHHHRKAAAAAAAAERLEGSFFLPHSCRSWTATRSTYYI